MSWAEFSLYMSSKKMSQEHVEKHDFHQSWSLMLHMFRKNKNRVQLQGNSSPIFNTCVYIYLNFVSLRLLQIIYSNWQRFSVVDCNGKYVSLLLLLSGNSIQQLSTQKAPMEPSHPTSFSTGQNLCSFWVLTDPYENTWRPPPPLLFGIVCFVNDCIHSLKHLTYSFKPHVPCFSFFLLHRLCLCFPFKLLCLHGPPNIHRFLCLSLQNFPTSGRFLIDFHSCLFALPYLICWPLWRRHEDAVWGCQESLGELFDTAIRFQVPNPHPCLSLFLNSQPSSSFQPVFLAAPSPRISEIDAQHVECLHIVKDKEQS